MKVLFAGGGTLGSVNPLIALWQELQLRESSLQALWLGTTSGPEQEVVESYGINYRAISTGKLRRYFSWRNVIDPFKVLWGYIQSRKIIKNFKPDIVISAGGFVAVPVVWAAHAKKVPSLIHQQDKQVGLANKLMAKKATRISVTFEASINEIKKFKDKIEIIGNPVRQEFFQVEFEASKKYFHLTHYLPVVLILGGGTGASTINQAVYDSLPNLTKFSQIIHLTGRGRGRSDGSYQNYYPYELLVQEFPKALAAADVVVSRAGMSTITEAAILKKPLVLIPMPDSHQELNAQELQKNNAAKVLAEKNLSPASLVTALKSVIEDAALRENLSLNIGKILPSNPNSKMIDLVYKTISHVN